MRAIKINENTFKNASLHEATKTAELLGADRSFLLNTLAGSQLVFFTPEGKEVLNIYITGMLKRQVNIFLEGRRWGLDWLKKLKKERKIKWSNRHFGAVKLPYSID